MWPLGGFVSFICFIPLFTNNLLQCLNFFHKHIFLLDNFHNITFLSTRVLCNLSSSSTDYFVPLFLAAFKSSSCSYLRRFIFKWVHLFRVACLWLFYPCIFANKALGTFPLYTPVQLVKFFNSLYCTIALVSIQVFIMFSSHSIHIQMCASIQG